MKQHQRVDVTHINSYHHEPKQPLGDSLARPGDDSVVITIDGPAGAGKSTVARLLAENLGFEFLDTGALYRCITLAVLRSGISLTDDQAIEELAASVSISFDGLRILLDGQDVSREIRTPKVAAAIGLIADNISVRRLLTQFQREWTAGKCVVTEGRDQGSDVFPDSPCKIFLVASSEVRARRRRAELAERGVDMSFEAVLRQQDKRDQEDRMRPVGALRMPTDALEVRTDGLSLESVVEKLVDITAARLRIRSTGQTTKPASSSCSASTDLTTKGDSN